LIEMAGFRLKRASGLLAAATVTLAVFGVAVAVAGQDVVSSTTCCQYAPKTYLSDQGETASFINPAGGEAHNVTAKPRGPDGKALFRSKTIFGGKATDIAGLKYLPTGSYKFFCTIHETMKGTYVISDKGTPVARPKIDVTLPAQSLNSVRNSGKLTVKVKALTQSAGITLVARKGAKALGSKSGLTLPAGASRTVKLTLTNAGRKALKGLKSASVSANGSVPFGKPDLARRTLR
jgi:plastocyanin